MAFRARVGMGMFAFMNVPPRMLMRVPVGSGSFLSCDLGVMFQVNVKPTLRFLNGGRA